MTIANWFECVECGGAAQAVTTNGVTEITLNHDEGCPEEASNVG